MKSQLFRTAVCSVVVAATLMAGALAADVGKAAVTGSGVRLRAEASTESEILTVTRKGSEVITFGESDGWFKVAYRGEIGYMSADYLAPVADAAVTGYVDGTDVRMRTGPGTDHSIVTVCDDGQPLTVLEEVDGWYRVTSGDALEGYIRGDYVAFTVTDAGGASDAALALVETAQEFLGVPYVYGGKSPSGFDCSGYVQYVFGLHGVDLNRTAYDQYYGVGDEVAYEDLLPGDIVFFTNTSLYGIGHCGIYIGDDQFIHATSGSAYSV